MKRREFVVTTASLAVGFNATGTQAAEAFKSGIDYRTLKQVAPTESTKDKVEVVEFFWYNCPHCNAFEPQLEAWLAKLPSHIAFKRLPVRFRDTFEPQQRLYYALEALGLTQQLHRKVFHAIHTERQRLDKTEDILDWVGQQGVDKARFEATMKSFGVAGKAKRAAQLQEAYQVEGVPSMGVAGRYYVDGTLAGNMPRVLQVVDALALKNRT